jgi:hypothetical protein
VTPGRSTRDAIPLLNWDGTLTDVAPFSFTVKQRNKLRNILDTSATDRRLEALVPALADAIGTFITMRELERPRVSNAKIRQKLGRLARSLEKFRLGIKELDPRSLRRLALGVEAVRMAHPSYRPPAMPRSRKPGDVLSVMPPVEVKTRKELARLTNSLDVLADALHRAEQMAREHKGGRPVSVPHIMLGRSIAEALAAHLGEYATSQRDGRFENVLRFALVLGGEPSADWEDLHGLVLKSLRRG